MAVGVFHRLGLGNSAQIDIFAEFAAGSGNSIEAADVECFKGFLKSAFGVALMRIEGMPDHPWRSVSEMRFGAWVISRFNLDDGSRSTSGTTRAARRSACSR